MAVEKSEPTTKQKKTKEGPEDANFKSDSVKVTLEIPLANPPAGYEVTQATGGRVQMGHLSRKTQVQLAPDEAMAFLQIREGLLAENARLPDGNPIRSNADVVRWLLAQVLIAAV
jgi:hypothetical protein